MVDSLITDLETDSHPIVSMEIANKSEEKAKSTKDVPRGIPKSGRFWKEPKQRASSIKKHKRDSLSKKLKERQDRERSKALSQRIRDDIAEQERLKRERQADNKRRREENAKKAEIVQKITDTAKIKKMKKKHLRQIEKRDTTAMETN